MDVNAISKELESIDIQLRESSLRERRALLTGYLEGVKAEQQTSLKAVEENKKKFDEYKLFMEKELKTAKEMLAKVTDVA